MSTPTAKERTKVYEATAAESDVRGTIVSFHGGAFVGGSTGWDAEQNKKLASLGFHVHQLAFPKTAKAFEAWAKSDALAAQLEALAKPLVLLGRSSGGYLAKWFYEMQPVHIGHAIYVCPVFDPTQRAQLLPKFAEKTKRFFADSAAQCFAKKLNPLEEFLFFSSTDGNVPTECFGDPQLSGGFDLAPLSHTAALKCCSPEFVEVLEHFLPAKTKSSKRESKRRRQD